MIRAEVVLDNSIWKKKIKKVDLFFNKIINSFPKRYHFKGKRIIFTILLSNNKKIKMLNKKFRNKNKPTDVLSFPLGKKITKKITYLGDIIISYEYINRPKKINIYDFQRKTIKIFIHGFLHLIGFDHMKLSEFKKMDKEELRIYKMVEKNFEKLN